MICEIKYYTNETGCLLEERIRLDPETPLPEGATFERFIGSGDLQFRTPQGIATEKIRFPIQADSVDQALAEYDKQGDAYIKTLMAARKAHVDSKIVGPSGMPLGPGWRAKADAARAEHAARAERAKLIT